MYFGVMRDVIVFRSYHIIVLEGSSSPKSSNEWLPSELGPYDALTYKVGKPYIAVVLSSYVQNISIGDGRKYSLSNRKRRNVGSVVYKNVALKGNTEYLVFQRAFVSQVWLLTFSTIVFCQIWNVL